MSNTTQLSPMVLAIDLLRVNINAMQLADLQDHAAQVLDTIAALNDYINRPHPKSSNALRNAVLLVRKLVMHMAHVRDLITAYQAAAAMVPPLDRRRDRQRGWQERRKAAHILALEPRPLIPAPHHAPARSGGA